ncbi:MAG: hypothetical protein IH886_13975 [Nitrospinae bacterium]|nr:hypothetical protein [Nitrospinota bacterium]
MVKGKTIFMIHIFLIFTLYQHSTAYADGRKVLKCLWDKIDNIKIQDDSVIIIYPEKKIAEFVSMYPKRVGKVEVEEYVYILNFPEEMRDRLFMKGKGTINRYTGRIIMEWGEDPKGIHYQFRVGFCKEGERLF